MKSSSKTVVAIPTYNRASFLRECLESLQKQTASDVSFIVFDNASTDETPTILKEISANDKRFEFVKNERNLTALENFKLAFESTTSKYFMWRADDDLSDSNYVEKLEQSLDDNPNDDLAFSEYIKIHNNHERLFALPDHQNLAQLDRAIQFLPIARPTWIYGLWRREALKRNYALTDNRYPYVWASDHVLMLPTMLAGRFSAVSGTRFYQRLVGEADYHLSPLQLLKARRSFMKLGVSILDDMNLDQKEKQKLKLALCSHASNRVAPFWRTCRSVWTQYRRAVKRKLLANHTY